MSDSEASRKLIYWFAVYVGIFALILMIQGVMTSFARLTLEKSKTQSQNENGTLSEKEMASLEEKVHVRSRMHGNNEEWTVFYCIILYSFILCDVDPLLFHILSWIYLLNRLALWYFQRKAISIPRGILSTLNYLLYLTSGCIAIIYGIRKIIEEN